MRSMAFAAVTLLCACGPSLRSAAEEGIALRVEPATVSAGGSVTLVLANETGGPVGYNLCSSGLEREAGGTWQPVSSDRVCTMELRSLASGEEARYPMEIPPTVAPGSYRFLTNIELTDQGASSGVTSEPFQITP